MMKLTDKINAILLFLYLYISSLTLPLKVLMDSGLSVWVATALIIVTSLLNNKLRINLKFLYLVLGIFLLFLINLLLVDYKEHVLTILIEFIKFGLVPLYLVSKVNNYQYALKCWYFIGLVSFFIWVLHINLVISDDLSYMHFGVQLAYSFIVFAIYFYNNTKHKVINFILMTASLVLIMVLGNRISFFTCLLILFLFEIRLLTKQKIYVSALKLGTIFPLLFIVRENTLDILFNVKRLVNNWGIDSYTIDKIILMINRGIVESSSGRDVIYSKAIEVIKNSYLLPRGIGYYQFVTGTIYPHNILLESAIIFGFLIVPIIFWIVKQFIVKYRFVGDEYFKLTLVTLSCFILLRLSFSGTFWSESVFWVVIGLLMFSNSNRRVKTINKTFYSKNVV